MPVIGRPLSALTNAWWNYDRPATYQTISAETLVPVRDGTPLSCTLVRPATNGAPAAGTFPGLIVEFTPYAALRASYVASEATYFATHGYNALVCNLRGTGGSGGIWQNAMSAQDGKDAHDLVEWLAVQPYSNGRIGMTGESYGGDTTYAAAINRPPHLVAIAPLQSPADLYHDVIYPGGIKSTEGGSIDNWPGVAQMISGGAISAEAEYAANRAHPTYDDYWQSRSFVGRHSAINVPIFAMGGWIDQYFRSGQLTNIEGALGRTWAIYGQWPHLAPLRYPNCGGVCNPEGLSPGITLAWFDHWVKRLPHVPIPPRPTLVSFAGSGTGTTSPGWREIIGYRPTGTTARSFTLNPDGSLGAASRAAGTMAFHQPQDPSSAGGSLLFQTSALTTPTSLFGRPTLTLRAKLSGPDANIYVELLDIGPDGTETLVNNGFLRASHRISSVTPTPVPTGAPVTLTVPIRPDDWRFAVGHRIAVRVSGGAPTMLTQNPTPVDVTVATGVGGSSLTLPTVSGP
ncbi:CocE/NonD family hydrolase [Parafrankia sp. FMc2]|uniref:CocE/NonD family hydrolase n=1 Tax=Parafrankia sp. FMc2 TaxID=3233196 RepID=UPI0034D72068